jgi:dephospho-CoA kinase
MAFGATAINGDGALDRAAMRDMVFADPVARKKLETILHPMIRSEADRRCLAASAFSYVVLVVPLLIESGDYRQRCDRVVVVDCSEANQIARAAARSGIADENVKSIMAAQSSRAERLAAADDIIQNDGDLSALRSRVDDLNRKYLVLKDTNTSFS